MYKYLILFMYIKLYTQIHILQKNYLNNPFAKYKTKIKKV